MEQDFIVELTVETSEPIVIPHLIRADTEVDAIRMLTIRAQEQLAGRIPYRISVGPAGKYRTT